MDTLGGRIINLRESLNMTQAFLADKIGVTKAMMSKYENNVNVPKADIVGKIADILNTTADYLIGRTNDISPVEKDNTWIQLSKRDFKLIHGYRRLNGENRSRVDERIDALLESQPKRAE